MYALIDLIVTDYPGGWTTSGLCHIQDTPGDNSPTELGASRDFNAKQDALDDAVTWGKELIAGGKTKRVVVFDGGTEYRCLPRKGELQIRMQEALGLPDDAFNEREWAGDLYVLDSPAVSAWLQANYQYPNQIKPFSGAEGTPWAGKPCLDIPFAGVWPK